MSVLCIDAAPNAFLARELAERGGGVARFLTSDPNEGDVATALDEVLADWSAPVCTGLTLHIDRPGAQAAGRRVVAADGASAVDLGDLPAGRPVWVVGRVPVIDGDSDVRFRLASADDPALAECRAEPAREAEFGPALKALFGARRVLALEHLVHGHAEWDELRPALRRLGIAPEQIAGKKRARYAENRQAALAAALKERLIHEALEFGLASAETAFVATREEPGKPVEHTVVVANALAAGWSAAFLAGAPPLPPSPPASLIRACRRVAGDRIPPSSPRSGDIFADTDFEVDALYSGSECFALDDEDDLPATATATPGSGLAVVYAGVPALAGGGAVLFDSMRQPTALPSSVTLARLLLRWPDAPATIDRGLSLKVYVDDLAAPRARVRLADLAKLGGERPLNLVVQPGQVVRIVLADPTGAWSAAAPHLEVSLGW